MNLLPGTWIYSLILLQDLAKLMSNIINNCQLPKLQLFSIKKQSLLIAEWVFRFINVYFIKDSTMKVRSHVFNLWLHKLTFFKTFIFCYYFGIFFLLLLCILLRKEIFCFFHKKKLHSLSPKKSFFNFFFLQYFLKQFFCTIDFSLNIHIN